MEMGYALLVCCHLCHLFRRLTGVFRTSDGLTCQYLSPTLQPSPYYTHTKTYIDET